MWLPQPERFAAPGRKSAGQNGFVGRYLPSRVITAREPPSGSSTFLTSSLAAAAASHMADDADDDDGDDGWEDEPDTLDLSLGSTKADLMGWIENTSSRKRDDETQQYLTEFFLTAAKDNISNFQDWYNGLTEDEKTKLNELAAQQQQQ